MYMQTVPSFLPVMFRILDTNEDYTTEIGLPDFKPARKKNVLVNKLKPIVFVKDESNYFAEAIEDQGKYFFRVDGVTVEIGRPEYDQVIANPFLYYFSTALKLHLQVKRIQQGSEGAREVEVDRRDS